MIRSMLALAAFAAAALTSTAFAEDAKKEVTLKGTLVCAKCKLKMEGVKKCTNALQVKEGEKTVTYILDDKGMEEDDREGRPEARKADQSRDEEVTNLTGFRGRSICRAAPVWVNGGT
jgi:hypothetical protein